MTMNGNHVECWYKVLDFLNMTLINQGTFKLTLYFFNIKPLW